MKNGTMYANKLKRAWSKIRASTEKTEHQDAADPLRTLAIGILSVQATESRAEKALQRILDAMVDWNEIRVSNPNELAGAVGSTIPNFVTHCQRLIKALQNIYDKENEIRLDRLRSLGRREARQYLESLEGVDEYAVACVMLWALGGHAIPVNDSLLGALADADLVNPDANRAEVQAFLERHISAAEGKQFVTTMRSFKPTKTVKKKPTPKTSAKTAKKKTAKKKTKKGARS